MEHMRKMSRSHWPVMEVIFSGVILAFLLTECFAGTIPNRPVGAVQTGDLVPKSGGKSSPRRIMHPAFANAGRVPGLEIWRVESFDPVVYPKSNYGKFFSGDSFIVLNTKQSKDKKTLTWDVHFWLGSETSVDEAGAAAILTVQLDDLLNGGPVQHREVQDHESQLFLSYFPNGVRYEKGGVGSGFKHVQTNAPGEKRLFQVKGKRNVRVRQVNLSVSSMNRGDCFILDDGNDIYVYVGAQAKRVEKLKAISAANQIRDQDHNGRAKVQIIDEFSTDSEKQKFFTVLGSGSPNEIPEESVAEEDGAFETADERSVTLYKVTDQTGSLKIDTISTKPLRQEMLDTRDCFILDTGSGIYVWVGKASTKKEKSDAISKAQEFLRTKKYPAWTQIHRIVEGAESAPFKQYFATWRDAGMSHSRLIRSALGYESDETDFAIDESIIRNLKKSGGRAIGFIPDMSTGEIVKMIQVVEVPGNGEVLQRDIPTDHNILLGFGSYIIQYDYTANDKKASVVYIWEGSKATKASQTESFRAGMDLGDELAGIVVRTSQGHEPRHFLKMFKGKLISTYTGAPTVPQLFRIRGTDNTDVRANEVPIDSSSLSSDDVFALIKVDQQKVYIWSGLGSSAFERTMAEKLFAEFWPTFQKEFIDEGAEPDDFWDDLNGEGIYDRTMSGNGAPFLEPRLFHCILSGKRIQFEEMPNFEQADLDIDDVMLVDSGDEIYMWIGSGATDEEKKNILDMAKEYIKIDPTERTIDTVSVVVVQQDNEPRLFKKMFLIWEDNYWQSIRSYEDIKKRVLEENKRIEDNDV